MPLCFDIILSVKARQTRKGKKHEKSYFICIELYYLYGNAHIYSTAR